MKAFYLLLLGLSATVFASPIPAEEQSVRTRVSANPGELLRAPGLNINRYLVRMGKEDAGPFIRVVDESETAQ